MGENSSHAPGNEISEGAGGIRQRKAMASGDGPMSGDNFGVGSLPGTRKIGTMAANLSCDNAMLSDRERCPPIKTGGGMSAQAHPDHGSSR